MRELQQKERVRFTSLALPSPGGLIYAHKYSSMPYKSSLRGERSVDEAIHAAPEICTAPWIAALRSQRRLMGHGINFVCID